jgi:hypothetical protein
MRGTPPRQAGFSFIDVMVAITILLIGVLALGGAMAGALIRTEESEEELIAKQFATSTIESIFSARDVSTLGFDAARNTANADCTGGPGLFCPGLRNVTMSAGPDGIFGTADDAGLVVAGFKRSIEIKNVNDVDGDDVDDSSGLPVSLRKITVTIHYQVRGADRQVLLTTYIGDYRYLS